MRILILFVAVLLAQPVVGQQPVRQLVNDPAQQHRWLSSYREFLSIPNVLGDSVNMLRNAEAIRAMLAAAGVSSELLTVNKPHSAPVVFGEVKSPGATTTIAFYAHYDGQPVNPRQWAPGLEPFVPALYSDRLDRGGKALPFPSAGDRIDGSWRLYGRGSADDKAGVFAIIAAYESLKKTGRKATVNIKFFFEGEEEAGSIHLADIFQKYRSKLDADLWVICDGPRHISGRKQIVFGVRGDVNVDLKVYAAKRPLHSGNYGNWAPNPAMRLAQLLAGMKDGEGKVLIEGFYDDVTPLSAMEQEALRRIPAVEDILRKDLALGKPDGAGRSFMELLTMPTLNINGMASGNVGAMASNQIPTEASAVLDLRLVAGNDVERQVGKLVRHIEKQGYQVIDHEPSDAERMQYPLLAFVARRDGGYNAQRTPMDLPIAQRVAEAIASTAGEEIVRVPSSGGSLPLFVFEQYLGTRPVTVPVVNYDNNQHAENENVKLSFLWEGIETMAAIMLLKQPVSIRNK